MTKMKIYCEYYGKRFHYMTYSDGQIVYLSAQFALQQVRKRRAKIVIIDRMEA